MSCATIFISGNKSIFYKTVSILFIMLTFVACGGGDDDGPDCATDSSGSGCISDEVKGRFLYFTGSLSAVDTDYPDSPINVESGNSLIKSRSGYDLALQSFSSGQYDNSSHSIFNYAFDTLVYAKTDGRFYKVSSDKSIGLNPIQVSNELYADHLCMQVNGVPVFTNKTKAEDYSDVDRSQLIYSLSGEDNDCNAMADNEWKMISLGMDSNASPIEAFPPVTVLWNLETDGSIQGWLVLDSGALKKCDDQFENCGESLIEDVANLQHVFNLGMNNHLLLIDGNLYIYDGAENRLSDSIFSQANIGLITSYAADESDIFFSIGNVIYKAPIDGSSGAVVFSEELWDSPYQATVYDLQLTVNRVVYIKMPGDVYSRPEIKAIDKVGGTSVTLASPDDSSRVFIMTSGEKIFYSFDEVLDVQGSQRTLPLLAGIMDESALDLHAMTDASWIGWVNSSTLNKGASDSLARQQDKFILAETTYQNLSMRLSSIDASTGEELLNLGRLPDLDGLLGINCRNTGSDQMLCEAMIETAPEAVSSEPSFQNDIFYVDTDVSESLVRVTETETVSESVISN